MEIRVRSRPADHTLHAFDQSVAVEPPFQPKLAEVVGYQIDRPMRHSPASALDQVQEYQPETNWLKRPGREVQLESAEILR